MDLRASPSPLLSAAISYVVEAFRAGTLATAAGAITAVQIFATGYVGALASVPVTNPSHKLMSTRQLSSLGVSALAFAALRKAIGYDGETFGKNFGYSLAVSAPAAIISGKVWASKAAVGIASAEMFAGNLANAVPYFPSDPTMLQPFTFPSMNPGCGTQGQLAAGEGTISACRVPRLAHQGTLVI